jgi:hypothetical protein
VRRRGSRRRTSGHAGLPAGRGNEHQVEFLNGARCRALCAELPGLARILSGIVSDDGSTG